MRKNFFMIVGNQIRMYFKQNLFNIDDNLLKRNKNMKSVKKSLKNTKKEFGFINNLKK